MRILISVLIALLFAPMTTFAMESPDQVLQNIRSTQSLGSGTQIDCKKITDEQAVRYGKAVYAAQIDPDKVEAFMKEMSQVEGNPFDSIYANMGLATLKCVELPATDIPQNYMSAQSAMYTQQPTNTQGGGGMMRGYGFVSAYVVLLWVFSVLGFAVFMTWISSHVFHRQFRKLVEGGHPDHESKALDILKERYARGDITKEQFDKVRKDLLS